MEHILTNSQSLLLYIFVYSISSICCVNIVKKESTFEKRQIGILKLCLIVLAPIIIAAVRNYVGGDFWVYVGYLERYRTTTWKYWFKHLDYLNGTPTGVFVISKIAQIFDNTQVFFGVFAAVTFVPVVVYMFKEYENRYIPLAIFIYLMSTFSTGLNIMKQTVAITFVLISTTFVFRRKFIPFCVCIFVASLFHVTALVALPLYLLWSGIGDIKIFKKISIIIFSFIVAVNLEPFLAFIGGRWEEYELTESANASFIIYLFWAVVFVVLYKKLIAIDERNKFFIVMYIIGTVLYLAGFWGVFAKRVADYYTIPRFILMAQLPYCFNSKQVEVILKILIIAYTLAIFIYTYLIRGQVGIFPYAYIV